MTQLESYERRVDDKHYLKLVETLKSEISDQTKWFADYKPELLDAYLQGYDHGFWKLYTILKNQKLISAM